MKPPRRHDLFVFENPPGSGAWRIMDMTPSGDSGGVMEPIYADEAEAEAECRRLVAEGGYCWPEGEKRGEF